ncbi:MAG: hypothetical protein JW855_01435 [Gammaproteobacteria bacterium]|nr:hypothetical protein [Gammaproteobacteria bacterium]
MQAYVYNIYRPSGNDTALVRAKILDPHLKKLINDAILKKHTFVEQVGFIYQENGQFYLEMAGGEFCGNATRSAVVMFLNGEKNQEIAIHVSGVIGVLNAGIDSEGNVYTEIPIPKSNFIQECADYSIIKLEGIVHFIVPQKTPIKNKEKAKQLAKNLLNKDSTIIKDFLAAGVIFLTKQKHDFYIEPVVFVKSIKTFFYETACGSGTIAIGLLEAFRQKKNVKINICQPSKKIITACVILEKNRFINAKIEGKVELLRENQKIWI